MANIKIKIPSFGDQEGESPIVIIGPNGSGKTQLAVKIAETNEVSSISAQRRTWIDDHLPVQEEQQLQSNVQQSINRWREHTWQPTEEINLVMSKLVQEHSTLLTKRNEDAIKDGQPLEPVTDTKLMQLQSLWSRLFPQRKLEIGGFFPKARRLDLPDTPTYPLRRMSDGERTILYMAASLDHG